MEVNSYVTLDDMMHDVLSTLVRLPFNITSSRPGSTSEIIGASLHLRNPRARLSRSETKAKVFSALGELFWYLSRSNDLEFIKYYIPRYEKETEDGKTIYGGYGTRLFSSQGEHDQIKNVLELLRNYPTSRRAVIQLFEARDISPGEHKKEIPCTCTLQFLIRENLLHMVVNMRSNDAFVGLPHDIFAFTMIQEILARSLNVELGSYTHNAGSLHLYDYDKDQTIQYLKEGVHSTKIFMPEMPLGDPWAALGVLGNIEDEFRNNKEEVFRNASPDPYWSDLANLFEAYSMIKTGTLNNQAIHEIKSRMSSRVYDVYLLDRVVINKEVV